MLQHDALQDTSAVASMDDNGWSNVHKHIGSYDAPHCSAQLPDKCRAAECFGGACLTRHSCVMACQHTGITEVTPGGSQWDRGHSRWCACHHGHSRWSAWSLSPVASGTGVTLGGLQWHGGHSRCCAVGLWSVVTPGGCWWNPCHSQWLAVPPEPLPVVCVPLGSLPVACNGTGATLSVGGRATVHLDAMPHSRVLRDSVVW